MYSRTRLLENILYSKFLAAVDLVLPGNDEKGIIYTLYDE